MMYGANKSNARTAKMQRILFVLNTFRGGGGVVVLKFELGKDVQPKVSTTTL